MPDSFPKLMWNTKTQIQEAYRSPSRIHVKKLYPAYHFQTTENVVLSKINTKSWKKPEGKKHLTNRGRRIRITSNFSEILQARREWSKIVQVLREKEKAHHPRILSPVKLSFKNKEEITTFSNKNWGHLLSVDLPYKNVKISFREKEHDSVRNSDLLKIRKSVEQGISEGEK